MQLLQRSRDLPTPPLSVLKTIGPSFILLGLALGSGELILWPYLVANWGLGILWGGLLGITLQFVLNTEAMRYTLATGESVFVGFRRLSRIIPVWYIISTVIPWSIPGFSSASAQILEKLFPWMNETVVAVALLCVTGIVLTFGKTLYKTMELLQKANILIGLPFIIILVALFAQPIHFGELAAGLVGHGNGWWFFPTGIGIFSFLGAFAYSGAGGNLNLAQSYYIKEKGFGMGVFSEKITSLFSGGTKPMHIEGALFEDSEKNTENWKKWWKIVNQEHALVFYLLGFSCIALLAVLARALVYGLPVESGISFLFGEAQVIGGRITPFLGNLFLLAAGIMLFSTQTGVLESSSRIISENVLLLVGKHGKPFPLSTAFYVALWAQIVFGSIVYVAGLREPRLLLTLGAVLNGAAMMCSFPLLYIMNKKLLPKEIRAQLPRTLMLLLGFVCFAIFVVLTIIHSVK